MCMSNNKIKGDYIGYTKKCETHITNFRIENKTKNNDVNTKVKNDDVNSRNTTKLLYLDDNIGYKRIDEINFQNIKINMNNVNKRKIKIKIGVKEKLVHIIDIMYGINDKNGLIGRENVNKKEKSLKELFIIIPMQKLLEFDYQKRMIKIELNNIIEKKIKEFEYNLKKLIYNNSYELFNGKRFSMEKINNALVSNIKTKKEEDNTYIKYISFAINKETEIYEIDKKTGNRNNILDKSKENCDIEFNKYDNFNINTWNKKNEGQVYCKCVINIENLQFVDNIFTYNLMMNLCEIEKKSNHIFVVKNGEVKIGEFDSDESDKLEDEYWDSASI